MQQYYSYLSERLDYDSETGNLVWNDNAYKTVKGKLAGTLSDKGYLRILTRPKGLSAKCIRSHRFIWWLHNGDIPEGMVIDHIDGNRTNNRIENLRLATEQENHCNQLPTIKNTSGARGVHFDKRTGKWLVKVGCKGKCYYYGCHDDIELASLIAEEARIKLHGEFAS